MKINNKLFLFIFQVSWKIGKILKTCAPSFPYLLYRPWYGKKILEKDTVCSEVDKNMGEGLFEIY